MSDKRISEMTPAERTAAIARAASKFQSELDGGLSDRIADVLNDEGVPFNKSMNTELSRLRRGDRC